MDCVFLCFLAGCFLGVNLLVLGLSEGITDRDLASLFHPYGTILHAKVMMDTKSGAPEYYGNPSLVNYFLYHNFSFYLFEKYLSNYNLGVTFLINKWLMNSEWEQ